MGKTKLNSLISFGTLLSIIVAIAIIFNLFFFRLDLTEDKKYTLKDASINLVSELEDPVFIRVYLEGEFPAEFRKLRNATKELLDELRAYAGENIQYEFIDPSASENQDEREKFWKKLSDAGLKYTNLTIQDKNGIAEKIIFPGAIISYNGKETPVQILKSSLSGENSQMVQASINNLEYNVISGISKATASRQKIIALIKGQDEFPPEYTEDLFQTLKEDYLVDEIRLKEKLTDLLAYDLVIVPRSTSPWSEKNKFILDQYIMKGGDVMFYLDGVQVNMDSVQSAGGRQYIGLGANHNLDDLLFNYGLRLNNDLIIDQNCAPLAINVGQMGDKANVRLFPWNFFPIMLGNPAHPISANIDPVKAEFISSIDTIQRDNIKHSVLLKSSGYGRKMNSPVRINLNQVSVNEDFSQTSTGSHVGGVISEGKFKSLYKNRIPPQISNSKDINFQEEGILPSKIMLIADGAVIKNEIANDGNSIYPLGFDKYLRKMMYGNKSLLQNAVNYMLNDESLIEVRSRNFALRALNKNKVLNEKRSLQIAGVAAPLFIIILLVLSLAIFRRRKYS